jgi:2-succinyl-6-hydroxy-2,4-cyclohexadiene-1-carboxylate synthase
VGRGRRRAQASGRRLKVDLHVEIDGDGPPLLLLHGFTGSSRSWDELIPALASRARIIRVDLIGHGQSPSPPETARYTLDRAVDDLVGLLDQLGLSTLDLLGYSMGGRVALHFAVREPRRLRRLILESASPGIEDKNERARRGHSDDALADRILSGGLPAFVDEWERQPLLLPAAHVQPQAREKQHALRLQNNPLGLANSLRGMGTGQQRPLWSALPDLVLPVSLIVGQNDTRYCAVAQRMHTLLPRAEVTVVADAGHTVHWDQPGVFVKTVQCALSRN